MPSQEVLRIVLDCTTIVAAIFMVGYLIFGKRLTAKDGRGADPPFASTSFLMITAGIVIVVATLVRGYLENIVELLTRDIAQQSIDESAGRY